MAVGGFNVAAQKHHGLLLLLNTPFGCKQQKPMRWKLNWVFSDVLVLFGDFNAKMWLSCSLDYTVSRVPTHFWGVGSHKQPLPEACGQSQPSWAHCGTSDWELELSTGQARTQANKHHLWDTILLSCGFPHLGFSSKRNSNNFSHLKSTWHGKRAWLAGGTCGKQSHSAVLPYWVFLQK